MSQILLLEAEPKFGSASRALEDNEAKTAGHLRLLLGLHNSWTSFQAVITLYLTASKPAQGSQATTAGARLLQRITGFCKGAHDRSQKSACQRLLAIDNVRQSLSMTSGNRHPSTGLGVQSLQLASPQSLLIEAQPSPAVQLNQFVDGISVCVCVSVNFM